MKKINLIKVLALISAAAILSGCTAAGTESTKAVETTAGKAETTAEATEAPTEAVSEADDEIVIAGIYKMGEITWFMEEGKASEKKALEMGASKFLYMDAKMDGGTYMELIDNCIAQKVDGVLVCIPDQNLSQATVDKLTEAGIPVIAVDDSLQTEDGTLLAPWVGIDAYNIGVSVGEWGAQYIEDKNLADDESFGVMLLSSDAVSSCLPRTEGQSAAIKEAYPDFPDARIFRADHDGGTEQGNTAAATVITGNPQITKWLVLTVSDEGAVGAARAIEQAGLAADSCVVGLGAYLAPDEFAKEGSPFRAAAYFSAKMVGEMSAEYLMNFILNKTEIPEKSAVSAIIVTPDDDLKTIMPEYIQ